MKSVKCCILLIFIFIFAYSSLAISVTPAWKDIVYDPAVGVDEEFDLKFGVSSSNTGSISVEATEYSSPFGIPDGSTSFNSSQLKDYVIISDTSLDPNKDTTVRVRVKIPPNAPFNGPQLFGISAKEVPKSTSGFLTVTTAVLFRVSIDAPYPNQYVDIIKFNIENVNEGESSKVYWQVKGRSEKVTPFTASLEIKDKDGQSVFKRELGGASLGRHEVYPADFYYESIPTNTFVPGAYEGTLTVIFSDNIKKSTAKFNIGTESIALDNYSPKNLVYGEINEVSLVIRNLWNGNFNNVYGEIEISGENITSVKTTTPSGILSPFGTITLKQFMDVRSLPEGNYTGKITIKFDSYSTSFPAEFSVAKKVEPIIEKEKRISSKTYIIAGISLGVLLIVVLALILFFRKKGKGGESQSQQPQAKPQVQAKAQPVGKKK